MSLNKAGAISFSKAMRYRFLSGFTGCNLFASEMSRNHGNQLSSAIIFGLFMLKFRCFSSFVEGGNWQMVWSAYSLILCFVGEY